MPKGRAFTRTGILRDKLLNSSCVITSRQKSNPAARAISGACKTTFVEPPIATATVIAFLKDFFVTISRGLIPFLMSVNKNETNSSGNFSTRRASCDAGATI